VIEYFIETMNFDERSSEANADRHVGSSDRAQLAVVAVNEAAIQLLGRTYSTGNVFNLPHLFHH